ncbi:ABC transporter ATP-binding protein [Hydrogenovibrio thermophilus]|uniref:ABC transporter ATP-binding protein n=1 Tax=Hydrogenovibrio thermophilus TaxID=265883 RepID=A0A410H4U9_9GAMM|nr:ABC transporter ATP-binding protein [Hydrogenovibrio thermophilus]QAB15954.1 ABC transporter ATP-binding protein [Hydrogenovibrio thermophilus]
MTEPRLQLENITKRFPGCLANDQVNLNILPGEIHALLGENGAGKSTLVKMIYGLLKPDEGQMLWEGQAVDIDSPKTARHYGIGMVFQHFSLFNAMTVLENIAVGMDEAFDLKALEKRILNVSADYGLHIDPKKLIHDLSVGERQRVEIIRCLLQHPKLLIMDEPTSVLTPQEVDKLFVTLRRLSSEGVSILYISHKLDEIKTLCHRATILRGGQFIQEIDPTQETAASMAQLMVGQKIIPPKRQSNKTFEDDVIQVQHLSLKSSQPFGNDLKDINFTISQGEVLGIAGIAGNGQTELLSALSGEADTDVDTIIIHGRPSGNLPSNQRRMIGMAYVPEERLGHASVPDNALHENAFLSGYQAKKLHHRGFINFKKRNEYAQMVCDKYNVKHAGIGSAAKSLSGGNLQKFIVGREIEQGPSLLIAAQPTWGVDAGAAAAIHQSILDLAEKGSAVLVLSQDLDEIFEVCDSVCVIYEGTLSDAYPISDISREEIGLLMGGITTPEGGHNHVA